MAKVISAPNTPKVFETADYNEVARCAELSSIQMIDSRFMITPDYFSERKKLKFKFDHEILSCEFHKEDAVIAGVFRYNIKAKLGRKFALDCHADFFVIYDVDNCVNDVAAEAFCARVGLFAGYPYFRALASHLSSLAGANLPPMPIIKADPVKAITK